MIESEKMSKSELSDGMEELKDIIAEYEEKPKTKAIRKKIKSKISSNGGKRKQPKRETLSLEVPMDKVIFGDKERFLQNLSEAINHEDQLKGVRNADVDEAEEQGANGTAKKRKPVWTDADDEHIQVGEVKRKNMHTGSLTHLRKDKAYKEYLTARYSRIMPQPKWASLDHKKKETGMGSEDEELLMSVGFVSNKAAVGVLRPALISIKQLKDLNRATYAEGLINSVQFHPSSTAALVAGRTGVATIYAIDGFKNEKLHSMFFEDFPLNCARITPCGTKAIFGSMRRFYYFYDLLSAQEQRHLLPRGFTNLNNFELSPCGRYMAVAGRSGLLHLFDAKAHELVHSFKQEGDVRGLCFTADSQRLICSSNSCNVNIFSLRQQRLEHTFIDEGCIKGNVLDLAPNQRLLATGSMEGVVNVYDFERVQQTRTPLPEKRFLHLTTAISDVKFNHTSELLAFNSSEVPNAVKLAHFPSATMYTNFPGFKPELGNVRNLTFSPASGFLAMGTKDGKVPLFRVKFFKNY